MERRAYKRVSSNITVELSCNNTDGCGTVMNLSENGMFISIGDVSFPIDSKFEIFFPVGNKVLYIPVKVSRLLRTGNVYEGIGIEIVDPPVQYLRFLDGLKSAV